jgi:predicted dehydrogenase
MPNPVAMFDIHGEMRGFAVESIRYFAKCVREGKEPFIKPMDGLRNTEAVVAIHESAETGEPVEL